MSLKQLAIRTKKSLSGLRSSGHDHGQVSSPPETPQRQVQNKDESTILGEFGMQSSPHSPSPAKDSPSRRSRFVQGSIRSLRKFRSNFDINRGKSPDESGSPLEKTPPMSRPSLALNFELSPPDQPMFKSTNSSGLDIHRSSPITIPTGCPQDMPVSPGLLPPGTLCESPAPLNKPLVQEAILSNSLRDPNVPLANPPDVNLPPTPMPGTNMPLEGIQTPTPEIVVSSPSAPNLKGKDGYFAIPIPNIADAPECCDSSVAQDSGGSHPTATDARTNLLEDAVDKLRLEKSKKATVEDYESDHCIVIDPETRKSFEGKVSTVSAYLALNGRKIVNTTEKDKDNINQEFGSSDWSRHTGLYDGTGYAISDLVEVDCTTQATDSQDMTAPNRRENSEYAATVDTQCSGTITPLVQRPVSVISEKILGSDEKEVVVDEEELKKIYRRYARLHHTETSEVVDGSGVEMATTLPADMMDSKVDYEKRAKKEAEMMNRVTDESLGG